MSGEGITFDSQLDEQPAEATPAQLGYRMPAEWEPQAAMWIAWPHERADWPGKFAPIPWVYTEIVRHLSRVERVNIVVRNGSMRSRAADQLDAAGVDIDRVQFFRSKTDRAWLRDSAPTFLVKTERPADPGVVPDVMNATVRSPHVNDQSTEVRVKSSITLDHAITKTSSAQRPLAQIGVVGWKFNGWAKYDNHQHDRQLPRKIARWLSAQRWVPRASTATGVLERVVMEGGAFDVNGRGTLLTTEECLLSNVQARNPGLDRLAIERVFGDYLSVRHVVWLGRGITGDDTHGHVDDLARFVSERTVVAVVEPRSDDPNHEPLAENWERLKRATDQDGKPLDVVELPMPRPVWFEGQRLPASYANFLIANRRVLVPTFNDPNDRVALNILASLFPDREVVGIHCLDLVLGLGTLHCLSQQQPVP